MTARSAAAPGKTTAQVREDLIQPATADTRESYADTFFRGRTQGPERGGRDGLGPPTAFVSHVHSAPFLETVGAVLDSLSGDGDACHFVWRALSPLCAVL